MSELEKTIKVSFGKKETSARKKSLELKIEIARKFFQGPEWLESLGRLESFENHMKKGIKAVARDYIQSAEKQLKETSSKEPEHQSVKNHNSNL